MPVAVSYPGVYVEEIPSGVRTITGVATSITAFLGRAARGPVDKAVVINNYGDFERQFGGLGVNYPMSYAVKDFYLNGGSQAVIVRLYHSELNDADQQKAENAAKDVANAAVGVDAATAAAAARTKANEFAADPEKTAADAVAKAAEAAAKVADPVPTPASVKAAATDAIKNSVLNNKARLTIGGITLEAISQGTWGDKLRARIEGPVPKDVCERYGLKEGEMFNLVVHDAGTKTTETYLNVSLKPSARKLDKVLSNESDLVTVAGSLPSAVPDATDKNLTADELKFAPFDVDSKNKRSVKVSEAASPGGALIASDYIGSEAGKTGIYALDNADLFNLLCIPPDTRDGDIPTDVNTAALAYCVKRRAMLIVDPPSAWTKVNLVKFDDLKLSGTDARNAAVYFPRVLQSDPLNDGQIESFVPCGMVAGVMARTDSQRGVWKAPAGIDAGLTGTTGLTVNLTDAENGQLNPLGINCLRSFPVYGRVVWGSRTMRGADQAADEWKYVPVRRTALYIEESLFRGLKWVVFEPNDEPLWAQVRLNVGAFMHNMFRQGAFQGINKKDAYFVKCDKETTTQNDINLGIVNILVGFAPLKPAEFVIIKLQQMAGQTEV